MQKKKTAKGQCLDQINLKQHFLTERVRQQQKWTASKQSSMNIDGQNATLLTCRPSGQGEARSQNKLANNMLGLDQPTSSRETLSLLSDMFDTLATSIVALCLVRLTVSTQLMIAH